jgi:hypothetical protein
LRAIAALFSCIHPIRLHALPGASGPSGPASSLDITAAAANILPSGAMAAAIRINLCLEAGPYFAALV